MLKYIHLVALVVLLTGCATSTTPVPISKSIHVKNSYIYNTALFEKSKERSEKVVIVRDDGFMGSALTLPLYINGVRVADIDPKERIEIYLAPKKYMFRISLESSILNESDGESEIEISNILPNNFRLRLIYGDGPRIERSSQI